MTTSSDLTVRQQRIVDALRPFFGAEADALYEAHGRSLQKLTYFARQSMLPSCHRLVTGLALAQELLVEEMTSRSVFDSPTSVSDFLKLHFAGQPFESFALLYLDLCARRIYVHAIPTNQQTRAMQGKLLNINRQR